MSNIDINLIKVRDDSSAKNRKLTRLKRGALILLLSVGVISVILFLINLYSPINSIKKEQNNLLTTISESNEKAVKLSIVNERVSAVTKIKSVSMESLSASDISTFYLMSVKINLNESR